MKKNLRKLLLIVAMVALVAVSVMLTSCAKKQEQAAATDAETWLVAWNVDRLQYTGQGPTFETGRIPREDGFYYLTFAVDGEQYDFKTDNLRMASNLDGQDVVLLKVDDDGMIEEYKNPYMEGRIAIDRFYVEEQLSDNVFTCNMSGKYIGMQQELTIPETAAVYDVGNTGLLCGIAATVHVDDILTAVADEEGNITHVFVQPYKEPGDIYWNITRMYSSTTGATTRESDVLGTYTYELCLNGEVVTVKTRDAKIANQMDKQAARCFGLSFNEEGYVDSVLSAASITGAGPVASWFTVMEVREDGSFVAEKLASGASDFGQVEEITPAKGCKIINATTVGKQGEYTQPRVGDQIHCLKDARDRVCYVFIHSRIAEGNVYWNVERKYNSTTKESTRTMGADGYYRILLATNGEQVTLKVQDKAIVNKIDSNGARCFTLDVTEDGVITEYYSPNRITGGGVVASWYDVTAINEDGSITAERILSGSEYGNVVTFKLAKDAQVINGSTCFEKFCGEFTEVQVGDRVHGLTNFKKEVEFLFVVNRPREGAIYWNVYRKYNSTTKSTTRTPDAEGYYHYEMCTGGKTLYLKTNQKELADKIDSQAARCWALSLNGDIICDVYAVSTTIDGAGSVEASWVHVTACSNVDAEAIKNSTGTDNGNTYYIEYAPNVKIYNISDDYETVRGEKTTLRVGDQIHCIRNAQGQTTYIWVISRGPENGYMAKCNVCKKEVLWSAWDGTTGLAGGVHYFLEQDVHLTTYKTITGGTVTLFLNGHTVSSDSRVFKLSGGSTLNLYDSMADGSDMGGKLIGKGLTTQEAKDEQNGTSEGGVIILWGSNVFNLYSGTLQLADTHNTIHYGGVVAGNGVFNMYGGKLTGGYSNNAGGTMRRYGGATVTNIYGGIIENGYSSGNGGHISAGGSGNKVNIYGGTFTGGSAKGSGNDIWMEANTYLTLSGKVKIGDVAVQNAVTVKKLEEGSSIGISIGDITKPVAVLEDTDDAKYFTSAAKYTELQVDGNELYIVSTLKSHDHCVCADNAKGVGNHTSCESENWTPWTSTTSLPQASGKYYLVEDVTLATSTTLNTNVNVVICLNGNTILAEDRVYRLNGNASVSICDHKVDGTYKGQIVTKGFDSAIFDSDTSGANSEGGIFLMWGNESSVNIYGGTLRMASEAEGGTSVKNGGLISGGGTVRIYDGVLKDGRARDGGGIMSLYNHSGHGYFYMYGGLITGGTANYGGNIASRRNITTVFEGGTVTGGKATSSAGGVYMSGSYFKELRISGNTVISGNTCKGTASNLYLVGTNLLTLGQLGKNASIGVTMTSTGLVASSVATDPGAKITSDDAAKTLTYSVADKTLSLASDSDHAAHCICGATKTLTGHTHNASVTWEPWDGTTAFTSGKYYYLTKDIDLSTLALHSDLKDLDGDGKAEWLEISSKTVNLCLNGHTITSASRVFKLKGSATVNITDHKKSDGTYAGALIGKGLTKTQSSSEGNGNNNEGGVFMLWAATTKLNIYGGNFRLHNTPVAQLSKGGIIQSCGTVSIYDGVLENGVATSGGTISLFNNNATLNLYGGILRNGTASTGAHIFSAGSSKPPIVNLYGGTLTGGKTDSATSGAVAMNYGTLNILGNVVIADNVRTGTTTLANVYISGSMVFKASGSTGANVGIGSATKDAKIGTVTTEEDGIGLFSDDKAYVVCIVGTEVQLKAGN